MGLRVGSRVRHTSGWAGTVTRCGELVTDVLSFIEVAPDIDPTRPQWQDVNEFALLADVDPPGDQQRRLVAGGWTLLPAVRRRYLTDARFHQLADQLALLLRTNSSQDILAALDVANVLYAEDLERERVRRER